MRPAISYRHRPRVVDEILQVVGRRIVAGIGIGARPGRRIAQSDHQPQAVSLGQVYNPVVFDPGIGDIRRAIAVEIARVAELAAAVDLKVFPGEFLPQPDKTGSADHPQHGFDLGPLHFLLEEGIDAVGDIRLVI